MGWFERPCCQKRWNHDLDFLLLLTLNSSRCNYCRSSYYGYDLPPSTLRCIYCDGLAFKSWFCCCSAIFLVVLADRAGHSEIILYLVSYFSARSLAHSALPLLLLLLAPNRLVQHLSYLPICIWKKLNSLNIMPLLVALYIIILHSFDSKGQAAAQYSICVLFMY